MSFSCLLRSNNLEILRRRCVNLCHTGDLHYRPSFNVNTPKISVTNSVSEQTWKTVTICPPVPQLGHSIMARKVLFVIWWCHSNLDLLVHHHFIQWDICVKLHRNHLHWGAFVIACVGLSVCSSVSRINLKLVDRLLLNSAGWTEPEKRSKPLDFGNNLELSLDDG